MNIIHIESLSGEEFAEVEKQSKQGFYIVNDSLYLKDKNGTVSFIWGDIPSYLDLENDAPYVFPEIPLDREIESTIESTKESVITNGIHPDIVLKMIAVSQNPELAFKK